MRALFLPLMLLLTLTQTLDAGEPNLRLSIEVLDKNKIYVGDRPTVLIKLTNDSKETVYLDPAESEIPSLDSIQDGKTPGGVRGHGIKWPRNPQNRAKRAIKLSPGECHSTKCQLGVAYSAGRLVIDIEATVILTDDLQCKDEDWLSRTLKVTQSFTSRSRKSQ